jgi:hypothetical protein
MTKKITFLLGAGASYQACPVWKEQGEKMIELSKTYLKDNAETFNDHFKFVGDPEKLLYYQIGKIGKRAQEFGTVDTYARKLYLNNETNELGNLKIAVSLFFLLWEVSLDPIKCRVTESKAYDFKQIDPRYISLVSTIIESIESNQIKIKDNIKFVTWNYDLQLERAIESFNVRYTIDGNHAADYIFKLADSHFICHLNGHYGITNNRNSNDRYNILRLFNNSTKKYKIPEIIERIKYLGDNIPVIQNDTTFEEYINYAWEKNTRAQEARDKAKSIFEETEILVIIGYSFPSFNKSIDSMLFEQLRGKEMKIYFQDPKPRKDYINALIKEHNISTNVEFITDENDQFFLPYEF